jgi:methionine-rich copper-binding protein CopC
MQTSFVDALRGVENVKRTVSLALAAWAVMPLIAFAHAHLKSSTPSDGSVLGAPPASIMLMFSEAVRPTALTLQKGDDKSEQKLGPLPTKASAHLEVPSPQLAPGAYTIRWRALGEDNHVMSGAIKFTVSADAAAGKAGESAAGNVAKPAHSAEHDPHSH